MRSPRVLIVAVLAFVGFYLLRLGMASSLSGGMQMLALFGGAVAVHRLAMVADARLPAGRR